LYIVVDNLWRRIVPMRTPCSVSPFAAATPAAIPTPRALAMPSVPALPVRWLGSGSRPRAGASGCSGRSLTQSPHSVLFPHIVCKVGHLVLLPWPLLVPCPAIVFPLTPGSRPGAMGIYVEVEEEVLITPAVVSGANFGVHIMRSWVSSCPSFFVCSSSVQLHAIHISHNLALEKKQQKVCTWSILIRSNMCIYTSLHRSTAVGVHFQREMQENLALCIRIYYFNVQNTRM